MSYPRRSIRANHKSPIAACIIVLALCSAYSAVVHADEPPYFVTYNSHLEECGDLEISTMLVPSRASGINPFLGNLTEFEYGATSWWTVEFYVDWQHTFDDSSAFTGQRVENRFRILPREHRITPILYVEYEHLSAADKTLKEVVGFDGKADLNIPNAEARHDYEHEIETKLILGNPFHGWDVAENLIFEKEFADDAPWEFGYAVGVSRPLRGATTRSGCVFCASSLTVGVEVYGGLGTSSDFTVQGTSHYLAPILAWRLASGTRVTVSPTWGLTNDSLGTFVRIGVSQEVEDVGHAIGKLARH